MSEEPAEGERDDPAWRRDLDELVMLAAELAPPEEREQAELRRAAYEPGRLLGILALPAEDGGAPEAGARADTVPGPAPAIEAAGASRGRAAPAWTAVVRRHGKGVLTTAAAFAAGLIVGAFTLGGHGASPGATASRGGDAATATGLRDGRAAAGGASAELPVTGPVQTGASPGASDPSAAPEAPVERRLVTAALGLRVRSAPSADAPVVTSATSGSVVTVLGHTAGQGGWYEVSTEDGSGWITDDPSLSSPLAAAPTP